MGIFFPCSYSYTDNTTWDWATTSAVSYEINVLPPPKPKVETALDWLTAQIEQVIDLGRLEVIT